MARRKKSKKDPKVNELTDMFGRMVAYYPNLAICLGSVHEAMFISQLSYWEGRQHDKKDGFIYKTNKTMLQETGLTRSNLETVRKSLKKKGLLQEKRKRIPACMHYKIDWDWLSELYQEWYYENNAHPDEIDETLSSEGY